MSEGRKGSVEGWSESQCIIQQMDQEDEGSVLVARDPAHRTWTLPTVGMHRSVS